MFDCGLKLSYFNGTFPSLTSMSEGSPYLVPVAAAVPTSSHVQSAWQGGCTQDRHSIGEWGS